MLPVEQAIRIVLEAARTLDTENVPLSECQGRILAEPTLADADLPPFDRSIMDGFALIAADTESNGTTLEIVEEVFAGDIPQKALQPGEAAKIMTGAPIPQGADCVVMVENTSMNKDGQVVISEIAEIGQNINPRAEFVSRGDALLEPGIKLRPMELGVLAFVGCVDPLVFRRPVCAILSTGDELVNVSETPGPGQIRNSNIYCLAAQLENAGAEVKVLGIGRDNPEELSALIGKGLQADILVSTGGASVGEKDFVGGVLQQHGVEIHFDKVALKPGKPTLFGSRDRTLIFGLPGNPLSALVSCELFVLSAVRKMCGSAEAVPETTNVRLGKGKIKRMNRRQYIPGGLLSDGTGLIVDLLEFKGSGDLTGVLGTDGLVIVPENAPPPSSGDVISFLPYSR
ncbi:MAG: molybdopterin molybdotransferase MoeA [Planctomycetota bacterium]|jgi:molybdopterin molybdotransferase|nr:molybdopterin molybdotransferase MoeA [Planctomycetota bacterium]MDP7130081.1 molybdopterin molybdotransferase MoeA [Planctomycetota bacterium]MDP7251667.1 molybdopterin molybdotransferase MoeA [Planctomycetota bacterium]